MVQTTGSLQTNAQAPGGAGEIARRHSIAPPGLAAFFMEIRWLAPPANFRDASGTENDSKSVQIHAAGNLRNGVAAAVSAASVLSFTRRRSRLAVSRRPV